MEGKLIKDLWIGKLYENEDGSYIIWSYNEMQIYFRGTKEELAEWSGKFYEIYKDLTTHVNKSLCGFYKWLYIFSASVKEAQIRNGQK